LRVLAFNIVLASTRVVPSNLLERELAFRRKLAAEVTPPILYGVVALGTALSGWGVWSLVAGTIAASLAQTILIWQISGYRPTWKFDVHIAKRLWNFGQHLIYASLLLFLAANLDQVYIGKYIDVSQVGFYGLALTLGNLSTDYVANLFGRVLSPALARVQKEPARLKEAFITSLRYISYLALPICAGIFVTAPAAPIDLRENGVLPFP
jgi:O-antigen/teichoic acid export membrane protein